MDPFSRLNGSHIQQNMGPGHSGTQCFWELKIMSLTAAPQWCTILGTSGFSKAPAGRMDVAAASVIIGPHCWREIVFRGT